MGWGCRHFFGLATPPTLGSSGTASGSSSPASLLAVSRRSISGRRRACGRTRVSSYLTYPDGVASKKLVQAVLAGFRRKRSGTAIRDGEGLWLSPWPGIWLGGVLRESESTPIPLTPGGGNVWTGIVLWAFGAELLNALPLIFHGR